MSRAQLEQFLDILAREPASLHDATKDAQDPALFLRYFREYAHRKGYDFTEDEIREWVAEYSRKLTAGELDDTQLDAVTGGAGGVQAILIGMLLPAVQKMGDGSVRMGDGSVRPGELPGGNTFGKT